MQSPDQTALAGTRRPAAAPQRATVACEVCPLRKLRVFAPLGEEEVAFMARFKVGELLLTAGSTIVEEGEASPRLYTVLEGMGVRYKTLENGRRQVVNFLFPGDFIGLQAGLMGEMKHSAAAASPMRLCVFNRADLWQLFRAQPERAYDLTWLAAVEEHFLGETLVTLGQRSGQQRVAWALLRLFKRMQAVGLETAGAVPMPFRQQDLADALGLSLVHTNKTLGGLRRMGLAAWVGGSLRVQDPVKLGEMALEDPERPETRPLI